MKKTAAILISFIIIASCVSFSVFAVDTTRPGTFFTAEQADMSQAIHDRYGIDAIFLYAENTTDELSDFTDACLSKEKLTDGYFVFTVSDEKCYYDWSEAAEDVFHSIDGAYIAASVCEDENGKTLSPSEMEDRYFDLLAKMLENRKNCPYKYIKDQAGVLTDEQENELNDKLTAFSERNRLDLVVVLTNGIDTGEVYQDDRMAFADDYYDDNGYAEDGALLLINIKAFDAYARGNSWISTSGSCIDLIDGDDISDIGSKLTPQLEDGQYYEAVEMFPDLIDSRIRSDKTGNTVRSAVIVLIVGLIVAFGYTARLKKQLKSVGDAVDANAYITENSLHITRAYDHFLYAHVTKTEKASKSDSSHKSSSGSSHGGGGF